MASAVGLEGAQGALVAGVVPSAPAAASLAPGDVITAVNGSAVVDPRDLIRTVAALPPGETISLAVTRDGQSTTVIVTLGDQADVIKRRAALRDGKAGTIQGHGGNAFGLTLADTPKGVRIAKVDPASSAADKSLHRGDRIVTIGGTPIQTVADVDNAVAAAKESGQEAVLIKIKRGERERFVALPVTS